MPNELVDFLSKFDVFTSNEIDELAASMTVIKVKKDTVIVSQGQICNLCYFVLRGCLRQYILSDGIEKTTRFYTEEQAVNFFTSYTHQTAAESFLCSLEDAVLLVGDPVNEAALYARFPQLAQLTRRMMEEDFGKTQDAFARFITSSPEERYLHILNEQPELILRVPQHQLASYLGMMPESLSRIKKRISLKK